MLTLHFSWKWKSKSLLISHSLLFIVPFSISSLSKSILRKKLRKTIFKSKKIRYWNTGGRRYSRTWYVMFWLFSDQKTKGKRRQGGRLHKFKPRMCSWDSQERIHCEKWGKPGNQKLVQRLIFTFTNYVASFLYFKTSVFTETRI